MRDRGNHYPFSGANLKHPRHERHVVILLEPFCHRLAQNRWSKRTERFTPLDLRVQNLFHVRPPRISQDGTIAESARPPFHPALKQPTTFPSAIACPVWRNKSFSPRKESLQPAST